MHRLVIVGASLAGLRAAQAARAAGFSGELVMIGGERHFPYTRPPLSKELLAGHHSADRVGLPVETLDAQWRLGVPAAALDRDRRRVILEDGAEVAYDRLIVATGCRARRWPGAGGDLEGVHVLRDLDDALALRAALDDQPRIAIIGAGFVGCEVAATARKQGLDVTLIDIAPAPMVALGPELGGWCADLHREHGVQLRLQSPVKRLTGNRAVTGVELDSGETIPADLVVVGLGAIPNTEWLSDSGLRVQDGVACDATLTAAGDADVLAAGDVVSWPHPLAGGDAVRIEHWTVAAEHGQLAGRNALLDPPDRRPHVTPPYFWSDQYDVKIQAIGLPARAERLELLECSPDRARMVYAGERDGRVVGVIAVSAAKRLGWYRRALADPPPFDELRATVADDPSALGVPVGSV